MPQRTAYRTLVGEHRYAGSRVPEVSFSTSTALRKWRCIFIRGRADGTAVRGDRRCGTRNGLRDAVLDAACRAGFRSGDEQLSPRERRVHRRCGRSPCRLSCHQKSRDANQAGQAVRWFLQTDLAALGATARAANIESMPTLFVLPV